MFILISGLTSSNEIKKIIVDEGELVSLHVVAADENQDQLIYTFSEPLDENGQWQTKLGDAGEYTVDITASDGIIEVTEQIKIIVNYVNRAPVMEEIKDIVVNEGEKVVIDPVITDEENDALAIIYTEPLDENGEWQTTYEDAGEHIITITVSDKENAISQDFKITVKDVNRAPKLESYYPKTDVVINEGEEQEFFISAEDLDGDSIIYSWLLDGKEISDNEDYTFKAGYESAGIYELKASVSDGNKKITAIWKIDILDINRAPIIDIKDEITAKENELIKIKHSASDPDGDSVSVFFDPPLNSSGEWQTSYEDAGVYHVKIGITDGKLITEKEIKINVENKDRAPLFEKINDLTVDEGEIAMIDLKAVDPDNELISFSAEPMLEGAEISGNKFIYKSDFNTVLKPGHWFNNILKILKIDDYYYKNQKSFVVKFKAQGSEAATIQKVKITVKNINRAPILEPIDDIVADENSIIKIKPSAYDLDNDGLSISFSEPLDENGYWKTTYDDAGEYNTTITISDKKSEISQDLKIIINNINRKPVFKKIKEFKVEEGKSVSIKPEIIDYDGDIIELSADNLPQGALFSGGELIWQPDYNFTQDEEKEAIVSFIASDSSLETKQDVKIIVKNKNRKPGLISASPSKYLLAYKGIPVYFNAKVVDPDNDELIYNWNFGFLDNIKDATPIVKRTFTKPGVKTVKLEISDGEDSITKTWKVKVLDIRKYISKTSKPTYFSENQ